MTTDTIVILIPVYNDWNALALLLRALDQSLAQVPLPITVLAIDDGSTLAMPESICAQSYERIREVSVLELRRNLGHQRALACGLAYVASDLPCRAVIVMDGDGEDSPADVPRLLAAFEEHRGECIVFAERLKRSENLTFRVCYQMYRWLHRLLTGIAVRVGNFSIVPGKFLPRLAVISELWNHYAAAVFKSRLPYVTIPTCRAPRLEGESRMNFVSLVTHGLSAISVFQDRVGVRLLLSVVVLMGATIAALAATIGIRLGTDWGIPGWATSTAALLIVILLQMCLLVGGFVVLTLGGRNSASFLPIRDCPYFVHQKIRLYPRDRQL